MDIEEGEREDERGEEEEGDRGARKGRGRQDAMVPAWEGNHDSSKGCG